VATKPDNATKPDSASTPAPPQQPPKVEPYEKIFYLEGDALRKADPDRRV
jgi:hypothetical protein